MTHNFVNGSYSCYDDTESVIKVWFRRVTSGFVIIFNNFLLKVFIIFRCTRTEKAIVVSTGQFSYKCERISVYNECFGYNNQVTHTHTHLSLIHI